jgi:monoamine oxidase
VSNIINSDTVIVGGGITGLYACYKLQRLKSINHTISLFECSNRFGGRIETVEMDGFLAEYGPMRFEKMAQPLLIDLISELGLETKHFVPFIAARDEDSLFDLTFDESGGERHGCKLTTLDLLKLGILRLLNASEGDMDDPNDPRHWEWWANLDEDYYSYVRNKAVYNGKYLYQMGLWNALSLVLSYRAVNKIIHYGTFYHFIHFNPNAAEWIIFWLRGLHPNDELVGIREGTESLVHELVNRLGSTSEPSRYILTTN